MNSKLTQLPILYNYFLGINRDSNITDEHVWAEEEDFKHAQVRLVEGAQSGARVAAGGHDAEHRLRLLWQQASVAAHYGLLTHILLLLFDGNFCTLSYDLFLKPIQIFPTVIMNIILFQISYKVYFFANYSYINDSFK